MLPAGGPPDRAVSDAGVLEPMTPKQRQQVSTAFQQARRGTAATVSPSEMQAMRQSAQSARGTPQHTVERSMTSKSSPDLGGRHATTVGRPRKSQIYVALYDYKARTENEMSFRKGDHLNVISNDNENWWQAQHADTKEVGWIPSNYVAPMQSLDKEPWYHGRIPRTTAEFLLSNGIDGSFLVRESQSSPGEYSISMRYDGKVFHYRVSKGPAGVYVAQDKPFPALGDLINYYRKNSDGLVHVLRHPVKKKKKAAVVDVAADEWEIDRSTIKMGRKLGAGQYGEVYEGVWTAHQRRIAVKTLKEGSMDVKDFLKEANVMKKLKHENLVQLIGICTRETPLFIITEFMPRGNLLDYLRNQDAQKEIDPTAMMYIAAQVASGMAYLEQHNYIHRDLAARNCLVGENLTVKLADFGLARLLQVEDPYTAKEGSKFPIKWTAPESLSFNRFTIKSDVWAFGICLWEIATLGSTPYPGMDLYTVLDRLDAGYRMPRPEGCPAEVYQLMRDCWQQDPNDRPAFKDIRRRLESMYADGSTIEEEVSKTLTLDKGAKMVLPDSLPEVDAEDEDLTPAANTNLVKTTQSAPVTRAVTDDDRKQTVAMTKSLFKTAHHVMRSHDQIDVPHTLQLLIADTKQMVDFVSVFARDDKHGSLAASLASLEEQMLLLQHLAAQHQGTDRVVHAVRELARRAKGVCDNMRPQESAT
ncbi:TK/ABL protein kinase [Salpingoeca rosetta]|uniref:non-specific protein-tyrosine kinase n=1 Tax=Salpingoeca rosetta (strain ATCC 50818 / BSB-021) TaxID=946362 RepID=F2UBY9_SALR5|nr:TK/ABL protein kinase [Salpingoeca rosetta]EGD74404.1 TK/ABL protein kinase [Salpingoeca rosetta]|eukprot:XP_004993304.1 TK/ABL protein kinase [Salpingoeca rosetta]